MSEVGTQHGYLMIADISGYTSYVARTELEHSQAILSELLEVLVSNMTTLLTLSKLEGDAVFAYVAEHKVPRSETILELVEATYVAFKDRIAGMNRRTTCTCKACRNIPLLDLKFVVHHGDYIRQNVMGINELVGSDVNLAHRLLKNHVGESTQWTAYALFTQGALEHMGIALDESHVQVETYEHLGEVKTFSFNLQNRYQALTEARRIFLDAEDAELAWTLRIGAPPPLVWTWVNDPHKRTVCAVRDQHWRAGARPTGRTGVGARNHCAHGNGELTETILDWRPFDYFTSQSIDPGMRGANMVQTYQLLPVEGGSATELHYHFLINTRLPRMIKRPVVEFVMINVFKMRDTLGNMRRLAEDEYRSQQSAEIVRESETAQAPAA